MTEELFLIIDDERVKLDLNTPSGITLNYRSNILNDLSKIEASFSYTFTVPLTANNSRVLQMAGDVRADQNTRKLDYKAEYVLNGAPLIQEANLYISGCSDEGYKLNMTWNVVEGFDKLTSLDDSINALEGSAYTSDSYHDYEKDDTCFPPTDWNYAKPAGFTSQDSNAKFTVYNSNSQVQFINGGTGYCPQSGVPVFRGMADWWDHISVASTERTKSNRRIRISAYPTPVMPVPYLLGKIEEKYGVVFNFKPLCANICVPLISRASTEALNRECYLSFKVNSAYKQVPRITEVTSHNNPNLPKRAITGTIKTINDNFTMIKLSRGDSNYVVEGSFVMQFNGTAHVDGDDRPKISFRVANNINTNRFEEDDFYQEIGALECYEVELVDGETKADGDGTYYEGIINAKYSCNPLDGFDSIKGDYSEDNMFHLVVTDIDYSDIRSISGEANLYIYNDAKNSIDINVFKNLPDISCSDLVKSLFYVLGGSPTTSNGGISIVKYNDLVSNIIAGKCYDWSNILLSASSSNTEVNFESADVISSSLAQINYFLMDNDEVNDYGKESQYALLEDQYSHSYAKIKVSSPLLNKYATIVKLPFYGAFTKHGHSPMTPTGNGISIYSVDSTRHWTVQEAKPVIGKLSVKPCKRTLSGALGFGSHNQSVSTYDSTYLSYDVWQFPSDLSTLDEYKVLAGIFKNLTILKENIRLNEFDVANIDYAKPVYIDRYNSYFAIKQIQYNTSEGIGEVELIKIPNNLIS